MTIARGQMKRQLYNQGGIMNAVPREKYKIGSRLKERIRKIIPNEVADIGQKIAPVVGMFNAPIGATLQGLSTFDKSGSMSDSLKRAGLQYLVTEGARRKLGADPTKKFNLDFTIPSKDMKSLGDFEIFNKGTNASDAYTLGNLGTDILEIPGQVLNAVTPDNETIKKIQKFVLGVNDKKEINPVSLKAVSYTHLTLPTN